MGIKKIPFFDFSAVLDKLQAIADNVHPTASGTSITPTGMHIVTEDDVQGAISELDSAVDSVNASLTQKKMVTLLDDTNNVSTSATSYLLSDDIDNYDFLICNFKRFNNLVNTAVLPVSYFKTTTSNARIQIPLHLSDNSYVGLINVYYHDDTHVYLYSRTATTDSPDYYTAIYGVKV